MKTLAAIFAFNEGEKIKRTISRHPATRDYDLLVMDDGSTDGALESLPKDGWLHLRNASNHGIGAAMKKVFDYAIENNYDVLVIQAGNDKDEPNEIPRLLDPIRGGQADFVQGSRFLPGGGYGSTPAYRILATRFVHPMLFSAFVGKRVTETTNGFRAFKTEILRDPRINWRQQWLDKYELEPYLLFRAIRLGYRHCEVPVTKIYPPRRLGYTKMKPITGWWSIMRPVFFLGLGIKK
ncbi:MAG TPA: glycosyltransferase family 2 protein [Candidatus Acidoferrales bacterium]|nr:glycosyltransferase family 2 protein [Candidatus Acidoferrales bacterium]